MFRLAQVTDPHFRSFTGATPGQFLNKRALGTLNLVVSRVRKHRMELLADLAGDLRARRVDHLAVTGDLGNVSLESEWLAARRWIEGLAMATAAVTVIPGNHDAYVPEVVEAQDVRAAVRRLPDRRAAPRAGGLPVRTHPRRRGAGGGELLRGHRRLRGLGGHRRAISWGGWRRC